RPLNAGTEVDVFPMPRIDDLLSLGASKKFYSLLDLENGFWQIKMAESDQHLTAFQTPFGLYKWTRMPFGLTNAPATFQRLMNRIFQNCMYRICLPFVDDNLAMSGTFEQHLKDLQELFNIYRNSGLGLKRSKCYFLPKIIKFLGHTLSQDGINP